MARALSEYVEQQAELWRTDVVNSCTERIDTRLQYAKKSEVLDGFSKVLDKIADTKLELADRLSSTKIELGNRMSDMRVEWLRWSFAFWLGQVVVIMGAMFMMFRLLAP